MRKTRSLFYPIFIFILAQLAWFLVVGLWIYRYVINNMIFEQVGEQLFPRLISKQSNILALVGGLFLMVSMSVAMTLIFRHLTIHLRITRMYDNFLANVTHELKSPLASIQLSLETLQSRDVPIEKRREFVALMRQDTTRLQHLIDSILSISGLEKKKFLFNFEVVSASPAFSGLMEETVAQFQLPDDALRISGKALCPCVIDRNTMRIVFNNLIDNAIKYSKGLPKIDLNFSCTDKYVRIEFSDHGIGISSRDQKLIFLKFHRIYRRDIPSVKGTGLGLTWVAEIIKAHGGRIRVHSEGIGKGTTFYIEIPIYRITRKRYVNKLLKLNKKFQGAGDARE
jgi:signal transduction histidine kinase